MTADGSFWEVEGPTASCEEGAELVWQRQGGGSHGGLPLLPQDRPQAAALPARCCLAYINSMRLLFLLREENVAASQKVETTYASLFFKALQIQKASYM